MSRGRRDSHVLAARLEMSTPMVQTKSRITLAAVEYPWAEGGRAPDFVLEITSKATQAVDEGRKRRLYRELGIGEYWQYDPTGDYLDPALKAELAASKREGAPRGRAPSEENTR